MTPQRYMTQYSEQQREYPTSPWTETFGFQTTDTAQAQVSQAASNRPYDSDTQSPTHDALSDIYNRDY